MISRGRWRPSVSIRIAGGTDELKTFLAVAEEIGAPPEPHGSLRG
jgi:hypothetical protein